MLGRDFVEQSMANHSLVLANRGITSPGLFPDLEHITIDRNVLAMDSDFGSVGCRALGFLGLVDAVVDFSCYEVRHLQNTVPFLPPYKRYIYISTASVYDANALRQPDPASSYYWYCVNKIECEGWIKKHQQDWRILRPCAVVGRHDYTGRFFEKNGKYYWRVNGQLASDAVSVDVVTKSIMRMLSSDIFELNL